MTDCQPMDGPQNLRTTRPLGQFLSVAAVLCAVLGGGRDTLCRAAEYRDDCESTRTSWEIRSESRDVQVLSHRRNFEFAHSGDASEHVRLVGLGELATVHLEHSVDASRVYDELEASVWVAASQPGAMLSLHVRLPHQIDPQTGRPIVFEVRGKPYTQTDRWEQISVASTTAAVDEQLRLWQRRLSTAVGESPIDQRDMVVDRISLIVPVRRGVTEVLIDDLVFGPIVPPTRKQGDLFAASQSQAARRPECPIQLGPNRILVDGKPFIPRFAAFHGENLDALRDAGINVALIERYDDQILMDELARRGIWAMASPPQPPLAADGNSMPVAGLMPIPPSTQRILFWNLGTRIPGDKLEAVEQWIDPIRDADRAFARPRPIMADVKSQERAFSRQVSLLGNSRHILHTTFSPLQYRDYLLYKKHLALPDRFSFTWLQTEPAPPNVMTRHPSRDREIFVEAEQIWMQALAAISVGHRAVGYWKSGPLDENSSAARERQLAIALMNARIELLQPWLATGKVLNPIEVRVRSDQRGPAGSGSRLIPSLRRSSSSERVVHPEIQAAVIDSDYGRLVIPVWYEQGGQFQPGPMTARDVSFVVRGGEHARAWEVTTTSVRPLELEQPVPGGMEFRLPMIDQFAFVIITNQLELEAKLEQQMREVQQRCAKLWVELAHVRLDRVRPTHELLQQVAIKVPDGDGLLRTAAQELDQAEIQLQAGHYDDARTLSRRALRRLRQLQRMHWENAVGSLTSPVSSPHTLCFETLPDHWRMIAAIGRSGSASEENLLRSGDFEDYDSVYVKWGHRWTAEPKELNRLELHTDAYSGKHALRLISEPSPDSPPLEVSAPPNVWVQSPPVPVQGGQIVIASGWIRVEEPVTGHPDGLMIYDNIKGTVGALRYHNAMPKGQWQQFRLIREVDRSRDFQLRIDLNGNGDVRIDDLRITALNPIQTAGGERPWPDRPRRGLLDLTPPLPKFPLWSGKKSEPAP